MSIYRMIFLIPLNKRYEIEHTNGLKKEKRWLRRGLSEAIWHWVASFNSTHALFACHVSNSNSAFIDCLMNKPMNDMRYRINPKWKFQINCIFQSNLLLFIFFFSTITISSLVSAQIVIVLTLPHHSLFVCTC